jgi:hypothetical protein
MDKFLKFIDFNKKHIKLDIGLSYSAPCSQEWLSKEDDLLVIGFEPNVESINCILAGNIIKKDPSHGDPIENKYINSSFFLIPVGLSNVKEPTKMNFYNMKNDWGTSSLYTPCDQRLGPVNEISKVDIYSLKHFFDIFPWDRFEFIDYIKIDAQGADLDIIKSAGDYIKKVVYVTAEPETTCYINCQHNTLENMINYMHIYNFSLINHPNTNDPTFINNRFLHLKDKIYISQLA